MKPSGWHDSLLAILVRLPQSPVDTPGLLLRLLLLSTHGQARTPGLPSGCGAAAAPHSHGPPPPHRPDLCTWGPNPRETGDGASTPHLTACCLTPNQRLCASPKHMLGKHLLLHQYWFQCQQNKNRIILLPSYSHWEKGSSEWGHVIRRQMQHLNFLVHGPQHTVSLSVFASDCNSMRTGTMVILFTRPGTKQTLKKYLNCNKKYFK